MNLQPRMDRRVMVLVAWLLTAASCVAANGAEPAGDRRVPWTSSRFAGTPDPPLPYTVEPAFPKLTFGRPVALEQAPGLDRLFVAEVEGRLVSFPNEPGVDHADVALDLKAARPGASALYGLAFHPRFAEN